VQIENNKFKDQFSKRVIEIKEMDKNGVKVGPETELELKRG
jgi:hypothetical protein